MKQAGKWLLVTVIWCFFHVPALAQTAGAETANIETARALFNQGDFAAASEMGRTIDTADGWAVRARALLVEAAYLAPPDERLARLDDAETAARTALAKDPENVEAMLHLVIALGYRARTLGKFKAHSENLAGQARGLIDRALKLQPEDAWIWSILGGWNGEIVATGGSFFGKLFYGASVKKARRSFDKAMALAPGNPAIPVEYAKMLLNLNIRKYAGAAQELLVAAAALSPKNAFEALLQEQGHQLLAALQSQDDNSLRTILAAITPFKGP